MGGLAYRHHRVQRLRRLVGRSSFRSEEGRFVVEGARVLGVALDSGAGVESVYVERAMVRPGDGVAEAARRCVEAGARVFDLEEGVLARVSATVSPQPVVAVVMANDLALADLGARRPDLVVVGVDLRDPGNAGAVLRAAEAAGAGAVVSCGSSVDLFNPKAVRASAGAVFLVPVVAGGPAEEVLEVVGRWGLRRLGTVARGGQDYATADLRGPTAIVVGNEASGLPQQVESCLDGRLTIPMAGRSESLNVAMATAVVCFEAARQRRPAYGGPGTERP
ncbi:MAG: TrmH family RNA methyltransferase [Acidimicrobiales bacterium]